jgi:uncharacterized protein (DUF2141 family)
MYLLLSILLTNLWIMPEYSPINTGTLSIKVTNITPGKGKIRVAIFNKEESFPSNEDEAFNGKTADVHSESPITFDFPGTPHGEYAIAVHHDINNNGKVDKNIWGIPTEPFGFSLNQPAKWRRTYFNEANFTFNQSKQEVTVKLTLWKDL